MNFAGHAKGGVVAGAVTVTVALATGQFPLSADAVSRLLDDPLGHGPLQTLIALFLTAWFMSLFPDLDVNSVPQRWFLRILFGLLCLTWLAGRMELFAVLALTAILPLLHRHRGWTHWPITPWGVAFFLALIHEYMRARASWFSGFSWENVGRILSEDWLYVFAAVTGHYTHLLLDARRLRFLPFVRNPPGHH